MRLSSVQVLASCLLGAILLCMPAYYNLFPLWLKQTPAYLETGFDNTLTHQVGWLYGAWLRHSSLSETPWLPIFLQGFLLTAVVYYAFKLVYKTRRPWHFMLYVILVSMTTAASFHSSHLAPDVFTPILLLVMGCLLLVPDLTRRDQVVLSLLMIISLGMSHTHWGLVVVLLLLLAGSYAIAAVRNYYKKTALSKKRVLGVMGLSLGTYLMVAAIHWGLGGQFKANQGQSFYLFARLWDFDIAQDYLSESYCPNQDHPLCASWTSLVTGEEFLYGKEEPRLASYGGWSAENEAFFAAINYNILTTPKHLKRYLIKSLEQSAGQLVNVEMDPERFEHRDALLASIARFYPHYYVAAKYGRQHLGLYRAETVHAKSHLQSFLLLLSLIALLSLVLRAWTAPEIQASWEALPVAFTVFILLGLLANAVVIASCWGYEAHYQNRVAWLLTLPVCWLLFRLWDRWYFHLQASHSSTKK